MGPMFFEPTQCIRQTSWTQPKKTSPIIAYIEHGNAIEQAIVQYYTKFLKELRRKATPVFIPNYKLTPYANKEELFDYISSDDYMVSSSMKGVCFAFEVIENAPNDYDINIFFGDHHQYGARFANGIPN